MKIRVSKEMRNALKDLGSKGESYDDVIRRLIKVWREWNRAEVDFTV